ncbi:MAG TPA: zinc ribbon domain-containing protein [Gaiellaceae bacterium]|nr:zinc ribbon domain-containing protein [Gaiellaceae bacterium]
MSDKAAARETAVTAADETCPRCGARRQPDQRYCLDCGLQLPAVTGRLAALRRRWIRRFGWYPGDWIWISLLTLAIAVAGAATAIALTTSDASAKGQVFTATSGPTVTQPATVPTATLPTPPEPTTTTRAKPSPAPQNGRLTWPANENGWTIVLVSYPKTGGADAARRTAAQAAKAGLTEVGVLDSSSYASLQPGYFVVFTGIYGSKSDADAAVPTARQAGFGGAYSRQIAR